MAALMAGSQWDLPIDGATIILSAVSDAISRINRAIAPESSGFDFFTFISESSWNSSSYEPLRSANLHVSLFVFPLSNLGQLSWYNENTKGKESESSWFEYRQRQDIYFVYKTSRPVYSMCMGGRGNFSPGKVSGAWSQLLSSLAELIFRMSGAVGTFTSCIEGVQGEGFSFTLLFFTLRNRNHKQFCARLLCSIIF
jgi:hypothetical protein